MVTCLVNYLYQFFKSQIKYHLLSYQFFHCIHLQNVKNYDNSKIAFIGNYYKFHLIIMRPCKQSNLVLISYEERVYLLCTLSSNEFVPEDSKPNHKFFLCNRLPISALILLL